MEQGSCEALRRVAYATEPDTLSLRVIGRWPRPVVRHQPLAPGPDGRGIVKQDLHGELPRPLGGDLIGFAPANRPTGETRQDGSDAGGRQRYSGTGLPAGSR